jgi:amidophosphoribosyltransferase
LQKTGKVRVNEDDIFNAIKQLYAQCHGGYAVVAMIAGYGIIGFRDPNGIRPICYGSRKSSDVDGFRRAWFPRCEGCSAR